jgi:hypothetical protein
VRSAKIGRKFLFKRSRFSPKNVPAAVQHTLYSSVYFRLVRKIVCARVALGDIDHNKKTALASGIIDFQPRHTCFGAIPACKMLNSS